MSILAKSTSNHANSLVIHGCAIFQVVGVAVIRLEVENSLAVYDFNHLINI